MTNHSVGPSSLFSATARTGIAALLVILCCIPVNSQSFDAKIKDNHKIYVPVGKGPFPVAVAIPGCSGVSLDSPKSDPGRPGEEGDVLFRRHYPKMAERLKDRGFLVVLVDYLTAEGVLNTCRGEIPPSRVAQYIDAGVRLARVLPSADASRISVVGWSHGGASLLAWLSGPGKEVSSVRSAVAVYPGCRPDWGWSSSVPVLMALGEKDDIASPDVCRSLVKSLPKKVNVQMVSYPDARHGFDLTEGPDVLSVGSGHTVGRNQAAGEKAWGAILSFLSSH